MVFHGAYVELFQDAFEEFLEAIGFVEKDLEPRLGIRLPVVEHRMGFPRAAQGDRVAIAVEVERLGHTSITLRLTARDATEAICGEAVVVRVCIGESGTSIDIPEPLRKALSVHAPDAP